VPKLSTSAGRRQHITLKKAGFSMFSALFAVGIVEALSEEVRNQDDQPITRQTIKI
jgi:hypothetical protein